MGEKFVSDNHFELKYCHDRYKTQEMCNKAVDDFLPALKFVPNWFVTSKMIKKVLTALYADDNILYFNEDFGDAIFSCNNSLIIDLNNITLDDTNYDEDDPEAIIHIKILVWHVINLKNVKHLKLS